MIHQHTLQTSAAFDRIEDALLGKTDDTFSELIEDIEFLLYKAKEIKNAYDSLNNSHDYDSPSYCPLY